jgi:FkbM family methyltransferase
MIKFLAKIPIFKRIIPSIIKKLNIKKFKYKRKNLVYELDLRYLVDRRFYLYGWDDDIIEYLNNFIKEKKCDYFLDIGSCWGIYSLQIASNNPNINVFAFDVFEKNIKRLKNIAKTNGIINIETFNKAIGFKKKLETFSVDEEYSPNFSKDLNGKYQIKVQQDLIDNLVNIFNKNIVIKMDVERAELDALQGSRNLLINNNCLIILETDKNSPAINLLRSFGFNVIQNNFSTSDIILSNIN